eukprot:gene14254-29931_t
MPIVEIFGEGPWSTNKKALDEKCGSGSFGKLEAYCVKSGDPNKPLTVVFGEKCIANKSLKDVGHEGAKYIFLVKKGSDPMKLWQDTDVYE